MVYQLVQNVFHNVLVVNPPRIGQLVIQNHVAMIVPTS
jgi:hypothetical protein